MANHRAWRIYVDRSIGSAVVGIKELEFRATAGGADWTNVGVGSAVGSGSFNPSFDFANAFGNDAAEWACPLTNQNNINHWVGWDLGSNSANWKDLAELSVRIRSSDPANDPLQAPKYLRVEWTDDVPTGAARWTRDWAVGPTIGWVNDETRVFTRPSFTSQTYWRMYATTSPQGQYFALAELELRTSIGGGQAATGGTAIASGYYNGPTDPRADHAPANAFDGVTNSTTTRWASEGIFPSWIGYQFPAAVMIVQARMWARSESAASNQTPQRFSLDLSADGISWLVVAEWWNYIWNLGTDYVVTVEEANYITVPMGSKIHIPKIAAGVMSGTDTAERIAKIGAGVLSGGWPNRITASKIATEILSGGWPNRITMSKIALQVLVAPVLRSVNGPVQIIGG